MPKAILIEEFHVTVSARRGLSETDYLAMRRAFASQRFHAELRRAVGAVVCQYPPLARTQVKLSW
jgi:hypothetical protein